MILTLFLSFAIGLLLVTTSWFILRNKPKVYLASLAYFLGMLSLFPLFIAANIMYYIGQGLPEEVNKSLNAHVEYSRQTLNISDKPVVLHMLKVNVSGVSFSVTPPDFIDGRLQYRALTTSAALSKFDTDIAVNASFFSPFKDQHLFDFYPHTSDVVEPIGATFFEGQLYGRPAPWPVFIIRKDGSLDIKPYMPVSELVDGAHYIISGKSILVDQGKALNNLDLRSYPRSVVGLDEGHKTLWLIVVDGKQPFYSEGISLSALADFMVKQGVDIALELDGGGSATMAWDNGDKPLVLNRPIHTKIPNRQRPVANHLLLRYK